MPITSKHPEYLENEQQWQRCCDCYDGEDAVKKRGALYLPKLSGQEDVEYEAYKMRAMFYAATARTVDGHVGALVKKPPVVETSPKLEEWLKDVTGTGVNLVDFIKKLATEVLKTNRAMILVDREKGENGRPKLALYGALDLINWTDDKSLFVVQEEIVKAKEGDKYDQQEVMQWREIYLNERGIYQVDIWQKNPNPKSAADEYIIVDSMIPTMRGVPLDRIPAVIVTSEGETADPSQSTIIDMVNVNLSHYRTSADLEHGRHFTALPTPWVTGLSGDLPELKIGSMAAWVMADAAASCGFLEFSGAGLAALQEGLSEKEKMMAVLGARMLQQTRAGIETAETAQIHQAGEVSALMSIASAIETSLEKALQIVMDWEPIEGEAKVTINREFLETGITTGDLAGLVATLQAGGMSLPTFLWNLKRGNLMPEDETVEAEMARIEEEKSSAMNQAAESMNNQLAMRAEAKANMMNSQGMMDNQKA